MPTPILHHYHSSLFSEKIRCLFGYLGLGWQSVIIPPIMPRPHLMPLSGGYRKTPILQIGANVYCDTDIIARTLTRIAGNSALYAPGFAGERICRWSDTELFRITVALNFRPEALAAQMGQLSQADAEAFASDRAELSAGAAILSMNPASAIAQFNTIMQQLEASLSGDFLFGKVPCMADFSLYHCLWFVAGNVVNRDLLTPWPGVTAYLERMQSFGHGSYHEITAEEALEIGSGSDPVLPDYAHVDPVMAGNFRAGDPVGVAPDDYGRIPVTGSLVHWDATEIIIHRTDQQAGEIMVHFPSIGFDVTTC